MPEIPADLIIRITDVSRAGYCSAGARRWWAAHNLDFRDFLQNGILARDLFATGDAMAVRVVTAALDRLNG